MPCDDCPLTGGKKVKNDQAINLRVDESLMRKIGRLANKYDCTQADVIRTCIHLGTSQIDDHPMLLKILPFPKEKAINDV